MKPYSFHIISDIVDGKILQEQPAESDIEFLVTDSRKILHPASSLFFALKTTQANGHAYIKNCYEKGVRAFIISDELRTDEFPDAGFIRVNNTLHALQKLAAHHRTHFNQPRKTNNEKRTTMPVIGITGSNGKTMVKEWLYQLLQSDYSIARSPKSYNSQIGVPLSVWQLNANHDLAIFEAGISEKGEMKALADIIQPTIGVFTFLGEAHQEGFLNEADKFQEKCQLFDTASVIIYPSEFIGGNKLSLPGKKLISWGRSHHDDLQVVGVTTQPESTKISLRWQQTTSFDITLAFTDQASIHNILTCCCVCLHLGMKTDTLAERIKHLEPVSLRLEMKKGIQGCSILNDAYTADISSLEIALHLLMQQPQPDKTVILADFHIAQEQKKNSYHIIAQLLMRCGINKLIAVGHDTKSFLVPDLPTTMEIFSFNDTDELMQLLPQLHFSHEAILIKGSRPYALEQIIPLLEVQVHETKLEINLSAIARNLSYIRQHLNPSTRIMAVVKAFSYGSGSYEIAQLLQFHRADYLAVAFADEGVALRKAGIQIPIMVMNADPYSLDALTSYQLEPEIYSFDFFSQFKKHLEKEGMTSYPIHIKIDTGMHRLGFMQAEWKRLCDELKKTPEFVVRTVMSHLVASEDASSDDFTRTQAKDFERACALIKDSIGYSFIRHLNNTSGILRHPDRQFEMVRLGIGLYGIDSSAQNNLETAVYFKTSIAQIKELEAGDTVGYNRKGLLKRTSRIATVRVGYADGFPRNLSNGKGWMLVKGKKAAVIGWVCMDMTMLDVTDIDDVQEGDDVEIFGSALTVQQLAKLADTIPYEILTGISQRVKRVYFEE